ncbi:hypothetical protein ACWA5Z_07005 [Testudinibacter sp. P80/BLE/0925]|uniref:hypothetical protein n=1 Tax=Testudinibacter sp. TW-1 TaxID=3417757 RepID=UPI003D36671F
MMKKNNYLLSLLLFASHFTLAASNDMGQDPFAFAPRQTPPSVGNAALNCTEPGDWLMDTLPLVQLKPVGVIQYGSDDAVVLWLTANGVIIDSRLEQVIAQEQWQIVQIEAQRIRLQQCGNPSQQKTIHL